MRGAKKIGLMKEEVLTDLIANVAHSLVLDCSLIRICILGIL